MCSTPFGEIFETELASDSSVARFISEMNRTVVELGCKNTFFRNVHGMRVNFLNTKCILSHNYYYSTQECKHHVKTFTNLHKKL